MQKLAPGFLESTFWCESPNKRETSILVVLRFEIPFKRDVLRFSPFHEYFSRNDFRACLLNCNSCQLSRHGASCERVMQRRRLIFEGKICSLTSLPDFIPWGSRCESVNYKISNYWSTSSERARQDSQNPQVWC